MITLKKDRKSNDNWILTKTDSEGFHKQINLCFDDLLNLTVNIRGILEEKYHSKKVGEYKTTAKV